MLVQTHNQDQDPGAAPLLRSRHTNCNQDPGKEQTHNQDQDPDKPPPFSGADNQNNIYINIYI